MYLVRLVDSCLGVPRDQENCELVRTPLLKDVLGVSVIPCICRPLFNVFSCILLKPIFVAYFLTYSFSNDNLDNYT